eukprot:symbB.v1.2.021647.t1/scaffold1746.1/size103363/5
MDPIIWHLKPCGFKDLRFFDLPSNSYNNFFWAPEGQYFVCAAVGTMTCWSLSPYLHRKEQELCLERWDKHKVLARLDEYKFERSEESQWDEAAPGSAGLGANGCEEPGSY